MTAISTNTHRRWAEDGKVCVGRGRANQSRTKLRQVFSLASTRGTVTGEKTTPDSLEESGQEQHPDRRCCFVIPNGQGKALPVALTPWSSVCSIAVCQHSSLATSWHSRPAGASVSPSCQKSQAQHPMLKKAIDIWSFSVLISIFLSGSGCFLLSTCNRAFSPVSRPLFSH